MSDPVLERKTALIGEVVRCVRERMPDAEAPAELARALYADAVAEDLAESSAADLCGAALSLWRLAESRTAGVPAVRVFRPAADGDGWQSAHTVVEVVTDDMSFLVDSVTSFLNRSDAEVRLVLHPLLDVERDAAGSIRTVRAARGAVTAGARRESLMHILVAEQPDDRCADLRAGIERVLADVRAAVEDWPAMTERLQASIADLEQRGESAAEAVAFLRWLLDDQFTFLGYRTYHFEGDRAHVDKESGLGVLRNKLASVFDGMLTGGKRPAELDRPDLVRVTKANRRSTVHRPVHMDTLGVKRFDAAGNVVGEHLFIGLFTSASYSRSPRQVPLLRTKLERVLRRTGYQPQSYNHKTLVHILDTYPRDELFQIHDDDLFEIATGILGLQERRRVALFTRMDAFGRFASCLLYVPRDRFDTSIRLKVQDILEETFRGTTQAHYTQVSDSPLARLHFIVTTTPGAVPQYDRRATEARIVEACRSWRDRLGEALVRAHGEQAGLALLARYAGAFPASYPDIYSAAVAVEDIAHVEEVLRTGALGLNLYRPADAPAHEVRLKLTTAGEPTPLSDVVPMLEHMGLQVLREIPLPVRAEGAATTPWIRDFALVACDRAAIDLSRIRDRFHEAFTLVWSGELESDGFNRLVLRAGLAAREVTILRAISKFLRQARVPFSQEYMEATLAANPELARLLVELFLTRFDPAAADGRDAREAGIVARIHALLEAITNLDDDRILRRFLAVVEATLRTSYFQTSADGAPRPYLAMKLDSAGIAWLPKPRPLFEIFVYSPRVEAVHLRGGRVARGGIRWSDRREDFRTEVLGLMKAQMVKNTVIVPVGSKGGFVVKRPPADRDALRKEVVECYRTMMRALLGITDSLDGDRVVPPAGVVRRDGDDPYLVVAADKGTATFSDIANSVSRECGFWLDDAFASGGSVGYDHKKMGITARGAWESVKRHFRETGRDIQAEDFTVVGVGDMAGDVFGNGMLLSKHIRLVAAFNHAHVFLDPSPDAARSFAERQRLFDKPGSTWDDYDRSLISEGGGVWPRSAKSIPVSPQMARVLGVEPGKLAPSELIQRLFQAQVDLLWLGGIGTYVRASDETDADVGDRTNDALRVDATQVRAKVVGEGANLGLTQRARVEFALAGGRLNTDFIDNSAGVDCSDHEVNLKILFGEAERAGELTREQRDALLASMTDDVAALVLRDNYLQTLTLSVTEKLGARMLDRLARVIRRLEKAGRLDRALEFLPGDEELAERAAKGAGLTRPELAVLLSYVKMTLYDELLASDLPDDPVFADDLAAYFPQRVRERFGPWIARHRLRREIVATIVTNEMINRAGIAFVHEVRDETGMPPADIARAYVVARTVFDLPDLWRRIEALDGVAPADAQARLLLECGRLIDDATAWFLRNAGQRVDVAAAVARYGAPVRELASALDALLPRDQAATLQARAADLSAGGVPADLARRVAGLSSMVSGLDIVRRALDLGVPVDRVARTYFAVGASFGFAWLRDAASRLPSETAWAKLAVTALRDELDAQQALLTERVLVGAGTADGATGGDDPAAAIAAWTEPRRPLVARTEQLLNELQSLPNVDLAMLSVASRQLRAMGG